MTDSDLVGNDDCDVDKKELPVLYSTDCDCVIVMLM